METNNTCMGNDNDVIEYDIVATLDILYDLNEDLKMERHPQPLISSGLK